MENHGKSFTESIKGSDDLIDWVNEEIDSLQWVLTRQDDNGFEVEMCRFHKESDAKRVAKTYQDRGHKQLYMVYKITYTPGEKFCPR
jgi:hypothetical protein